MVYMELFPIDADEFPQLQDAMEKLSLHDAALASSGTHSPALGNGLRVGFLGILHGEIVLERLKREFDLDLIATAPTVSYTVTFTDGTQSFIRSSSDFPDSSQIKKMEEPMTDAMIFTPVEYAGSILQLVQDRRGTLENSANIGIRVRLNCKIPLAELITDFHDRLKSISSGFASLEYELSEYREIDAVKVSVLVAGELIEALSVIAVKDQAELIGKNLVKKLKEVVPRQLFEVPIQAAIGGKIIARETIKAYRKDVTAKLYGGDVTRRQKLLKKQAKGKKRLKQFGKVELNQDAFLAVLKR
jgi:GTP-binding protein LepA